MIALLLSFLISVSSLIASDQPSPNGGAGGAGGAGDTGGAASELKAFPKPGEGMVRYVIMLPPQPEEDLFKVEFLIGKTVKLDAHNRYFFGGMLESETIKGWGYDRYILKSLGPMVGTLMAVDPTVPKVDRFVTLGGEPQLLRYNSRLPLVVYVPDGVEVRFRVWRGDNITRNTM